MRDAEWWRQAVVYQIYPRSFADANGDGIGDLRGIISRIPYLAELGVDAVWLSPFYPSALADGGYDVDDYRDVDPRIGTLDEFDEMSRGLHEAGIRLIVDIVPNHSSDRHAWFREALAAPKGSPARDRYIFRDGLGADGERPPADWKAAFGGNAWTQVTEPDGTPGQWYLHTFAIEQPDWNWNNPEVREDFLTTLRFWADRGVDGFRVDAANMLAKDLPAELPSAAELAAMPLDGTHPTIDRDEVQDIYATWRAVFNEYDPPRTAVAEAWVPDPVRRARYASPRSLGQSFDDGLLKADFEASAFRAIVEQNLRFAEVSGSTATWVLSNHDVVRHATRFGLPPLAGRKVKQGRDWILAGAPEDQLDRPLGLSRARAATLFALALPGSAYLYQGEELGLHEVGTIPDEQRQDPGYWRSKDSGSWNEDGKGRDGARVPIPWSRGGSSFGFGPDGAHLPQPEWFGASSVQAEEDDPDSTLTLYRTALRLRRELESDEELTWDDEISQGQVLAFTRPGGWLTVTNFGDTPVNLPEGKLLLASRPIATDPNFAALRIPGATTVWMTR